MSDNGVVILFLFGGLVALSWIFRWISNTKKQNRTEKEHADARRTFEE